MTRRKLALVEPVGEPLTFTSQGKPIGVNESYRIVRIRNHGAMIKTPEAHAYAARLRRDAGAHAPIVGPVDVRIRFVYPNRRSDLDGSIKPTLDALQGIAYGNDRQVERLLVEKSVEPSAPRVEYDARPLAYGPCPYCGGDVPVNSWDEAWRAAA